MFWYQVYLEHFFEKKAQTLLQKHFVLAQMLGHWRWDLTTAMRHHRCLGRRLDPRNLGRDHRRSPSWRKYESVLFELSNSLQYIPYCNTVYRVDILHSWRHFCQTMRIGFRQQSHRNAWTPPPSQKVWGGHF